MSAKADVLDSEMVPPCLADISQILRVAKNLYYTHPRIAYLCVWGALKETTKLDPLSLGTGVAQFKFSLRSWIERNDKANGKGELQPSDVHDMQNFFLKFYEENIQALIKMFSVKKNSKASSPNDNLASTSVGVRANRSQLLTTACQTALTLYKILVLLSKDVPLPLKILETHAKVERQVQIFKPYNIVPFDPYSDDHPTRRLTEIQAVLNTFLKK